jgi:hypothetical protein
MKPLPKKPWLLAVPMTPLELTPGAAAQSKDHATLELAPILMKCWLSLRLPHEAAVRCLNFWKKKRLRRGDFQSRLPKCTTMSRLRQTQQRAGAPPAACTGPVASTLYRQKQQQQQQQQPPCE